MNDDNELFKKLAKMSHDELIAYMKIVKNANIFLSVVGVILIYTMISFPNILGCIALGIIVYLVANLACGMDIVKQEVTKNIEKAQAPRR